MQKRKTIFWDDDGHFEDRHFPRVTALCCGRKYLIKESWWWQKRGPFPRHVLAFIVHLNSWLPWDLCSGTLWQSNAISVRVILQCTNRGQLWLLSWLSAFPSVAIFLRKHQLYSLWKCLAIHVHTPMGTRLWESVHIKVWGFQKWFKNTIDGNFFYNVTICYLGSFREDNAICFMSIASVDSYLISLPSFLIRDLTMVDVRTILVA